MCYYGFFTGKACAIDRLGNPRQDMMRHVLMLPIACSTARAANHYCDELKTMPQRDSVPPVVVLLGTQGDRCPLHPVSTTRDADDREPWFLFAGRWMLCIQDFPLRADDDIMGAIARLDAGEASTETRALRFLRAALTAALPDMWTTVVGAANGRLDEAERIRVLAARIDEDITECGVQEVEGCYPSQYRVLIAKMGDTKDRKDTPAST
ncbi:hypothetical protein K505DRAFT_14993 [Melanomma pulvis-pyrius CBS 109.77]|uniref:Uncharacterized protein n=1 Tax=Melanomma pulvis-pyrius CBS 109.77 TaxID=1314802 RepID=A0A6A6WNK1_9PLEO|nr:hypothetical protein K505DRAFT_14993 [Melanomma pulvis-pyrius CBS 109.77]